MRKTILLISVLFAFLKVSAVDTLVFESDYLPKNDTVLVFSPQVMDDLSKYPVVYLLHGFGGDYAHWSEMVDLQAYAERYQMHIVCPDGLRDSWYIDCPRHREIKFEQFFVKDLMPKINKTYQVDTTLSFISGLSMGGHGAMYLFLRNPNLFYSAASTSGVLSLHYSGLKYSNLSHRLGDYSTHKHVFDQYSSINMLDTIAYTDREILVDCGTDDHLYKANVEFYNECLERRIPVHFISSPGRHNEAYWSKSIDWHFVFFERLVREQKQTQ
jgi:S-formylglutathione hydrolase FrmB